MGQGRCAACGQDLPSGARKDARYCGTNCRSQAYRRRKGPRRTRQDETQTADSPVLDAAPLARDEAITAAAPAAPEQPRESEPASIPAPPSRSRPAHEPRPEAAAQPRRRMALSHQLRSQAPAGAIGYRLVLPPAAPGQRRRLVPRRREDGARGFWRLNPLQLPDDPRLQDGQVYRVRWVDGNGQQIVPTPGAGVSAIYYFLGPADCSGDPLDDELQALLALTADRPEHAELRAALLQKRAARLDAQLAAERDRELQARAARSQAESRKVQRELRASLKELERVRRRQERRAARQERERGIDWAALAPLMNSVIAALGEAGCAYYELRAPFEELAKQGKPAPLVLVVAQRFLDALKAHLGPQYLEDPAASMAVATPEQVCVTAAPAPAPPGSEVREPQAASATVGISQPEPESASASAVEGPHPLTAEVRADPPSSYRATT